MAEYPSESCALLIGLGLVKVWFEADKPLLERTRPGYRQIIAAQLGISVLVALAWGGFKGANSAASALAGGLVCVIPSALFALRLWIAMRRGAEAVGAFVGGQLLKMVAIAALMFLVLKLFSGLDHLAFIVGLAAALHGYLFALLIVR